DANLMNAAKTGTLTCDSDHPCVLAADFGGDAAGTLTTSSILTPVTAPISFAPTAASCPPSTAPAIQGSGAESAYHAFFKWQTTVCGPPRNQVVGYVSDPLGSSEAGVTNFFDSFAAGFPPSMDQFAVTGPIPGTGPAEVQADGSPRPTPPGLTVAYAPIAATAIVLVYKLYTLDGTQVTNLTLTPDIVARMYGAGDPITGWNAPEIRALNPQIPASVRLAPNIGAYYPLEHSEQSLLFTWWLSQYAPSWTQGITDTFAGKVNGACGGGGVGGVPNVSLGVFGAKGAAFNFGCGGTIGFMDWASAQFYGLPIVNLKLPGDTTPRVATADSVERALKDANVTSDNFLAPSQTLTNDKQAYPIPAPIYMMVPTNAIDPSLGKPLADFLSWAVTDGQADLPAGYVPLPQNLVDASKAVAARIPQTPGSSGSSGSPGSSSSGGLGSTDLGLVGLGPSQLPGTGLASLLPGNGSTSAPKASPVGSVAKGPAAKSLLGLPANQGAQLALLARLAGLGAAYILPILTLLGAMGLVGGVGLEVLARRTQLSFALGQFSDSVRSIPGPWRR
ncbi:MAG: substrate-binding domain-containing protein, partial [Actinobacteria bacterium]|nr:substrate-binding domain-containing protein [Actinomycetota bacterium]